MIKYKDFYKEELGLETQSLYHATYLPLLRKIKKEGLVPNKKKKRWEDSKNFVYLSDDIDVAISYAESSEIVPDEWIDNIVVIEIDKGKLDINNLLPDENVRSEVPSNSFQYSKIIPPTSFKSIKRADEI